MYGTILLYPSNFVFSAILMRFSDVDLSRALRGAGAVVIADPRNEEKALFREKRIFGNVIRTFTHS